MARTQRPHTAPTSQRTTASARMPAVTARGDDPTSTASSVPEADERTIVERRRSALQVRDRDRYEVLGEHGRGGLGRVSRAHDKELGRDVAIKELIKRGNLAEVRFLREAIITARLEHPGIVPIHEAGCWPDGTPYYAMKLVSGRSLKDLISDCQTRDARLALLPHVIAVSDAIAYAHGRSIIHRDLKPANVIVGEFGETVVIDWGLAKDLSAADERSAEPDPLVPYARRSLASSELTLPGCIVGTPAYMAPEQARGEPVDERVDVFAIGAMLWELCTGTRGPPSDARPRQLVRAGIDQDLAIIVGKALAPDPQDRYPDAATLATDLKAFQTGARIAARSYSLFAMLAHWTRRRRKLAVSVIALAVVAIATVVGFVRNIAIQRDRADASATEANAQRRSAEQMKDEIVLQHAELQLHSDPTAAVSTLATYDGTDALQLQRLRAEAIGRGVATAVFRPHSNQIRFLAGDPGGAVTSVSEDHTIRVTRDGASTTLATNLAPVVVLAHAEPAHLLAYATTPSGIAVLSLTTHAITTIDTAVPARMDVAPDGSRLSAFYPDGWLRIWSLAPRVAIVHEVRVPGASFVEFSSPTQLVVQQPGSLRTVRLDAPQAAKAVALASRSIAVDARHVAIGDDHGVITLLSSDLAVLSTTPACRKAVTVVSLVPHTDLMAFACEEGVAGVARHDPATARLTVADTFRTAEEPFNIRSDALGRHIVVADSSTFVYVYDVETKLVRRYEGHAALVSAIAPATPEYDHILVGDIHGTVRVWDPPERAARKVLQAPTSALGVTFAPDGTSVLSNAVDEVVRRVHLADGAITELRGHTSYAARASFSPDGQSILTFSDDGTARVWRASDGKVTRVFADHASPVRGAGFVASGHRVVSIGDDGRLLAWSPDGTDQSVLFTRPLPLTTLELLSPTDHAVVLDSSGSIWDVAPSGASRQVRSGDGTTVTVLRASPDGRRVATGTDKGLVVVYDTTSWTILQTAQVGGGVRQLRFDPRSRDLIVASEDRRVRVIALGAARTLPWRDIPMPVRNIAYGPDGETLAFVCTDGGAWFYDIRNDIWAYTLDHASDTFSAAFSPDSAWFASSDRRGTVTIRDLAATFATAAHRR